MFYNAQGQVTERHMGYSFGQYPELRQTYTYLASENFRLTSLQSGLLPSNVDLQDIS